VFPPELDGGQLLSSLSPNDVDRVGDVLLPTLRRQSRYWIPLLLGWLRGGGGGGSDSAYYDNSLDLPLTSKQRRQQRQKESQSSSSSSSSPPEVQIEALRALAALTEWTSRGGTTTDVPGGGVRGSGAARRSADVAATTAAGGVGAAGGCSPHAPLSSASQRLLLRHADAVPMIVSLLSSGDAAVREQATWMLGSIASGGLGAASLPPVPSPVSPVVARVTTPEGGTTGAEGGCSSATTPAAAASSSSSSDAITAAAAGGGAGDPHDDAPSSSSRGGGKDKSSLSARDVIFAAGAVAPLLRCLAENAGDVPLHRVGAWCLSGLVEGRYSTSSSSS